MSYIHGFVAAVPQKNRHAYLDHLRAAPPLFKEHRATRVVGNWGDHVPEGKITDFHRAVQKKDGEAVLFGWIEWPSKQTRDASIEGLSADERMKARAMPFDGKRVIFGGFAPMIEQGSAKDIGYADGFVVPVPVANRDAYIQAAAHMARVFAEHGALRIVENWGDDVPHGKVTDFRRSVEARDGETIVFSWIEWPSKQARDEAWPKLMADPRMQPDKANMPFDGQRMIHGGFTTIFDA